MTLYVGFAGLQVPSVISPTTGHLSFTGHQPVVAGSSGQLEVGFSALQAPTLQTLLQVGFAGLQLAAEVGTPTGVTPATGHASLAGYAPAVNSWNVRVEWNDVGFDEGYRVKWGFSSGNYTQSRDVPTNTLYAIIGPFSYWQHVYFVVAALVNGSEQTPSAEKDFLAGHIFEAVTGHLSLHGYASTVSRGGWEVATTTGHLSLTGRQPSLSRMVAPTRGRLALTGRTPTVVVGPSSPSIAPSSGHLTLRGQRPILLRTISAASARQLSAPLLLELSRTVTEPGVLVEIGFAEVRRFSSLGDVTWNGVSWLSADIEVTLPKMDGSGKAECSVRIGNTAEAVGILVMRDGIAGRPLNIWIAYAGALGNADVVQVFSGVGGDSTIGDDDVIVSGTVDSIKAQYSPRKRINASTGFNVLLPKGTRLRIGNGVIIILDR